MTPPLLQGRGVSKRFGGLHVLRDVSFSVAEREIVALIGPNGAGKTTLFNLISGLVRPSAGEITVVDCPITRLAPYRITRLGLGRTFQSPRPFLELTAAANARTAALFGPEPEVGINELLALVGLTAQAEIPARHLPTGRRKLLELAMALALKPRLLLLDEILAGLTPPEVDRLTAVLRRIREEWGVALFWIDHNMRAVMGTAERVIVLHHGEIISEGDPAAVSRDVRVVQAYLGTAPGTPHVPTS